MNLETMEQKNARNARVSAQYDDLMDDGKHGHYETMFRIVRIEVELAVAEERERCAMKLQVTRADVQLAAGELSTEEWRMCAAVLRWMQGRIRGAQLKSSPAALAQAACNA